MHMRENGAFGRQFFYPFKRLAEREMAGMRTILQRIDDKHIGTAQILETLLRKSAHVGAVNDGTDAKAQRLNVAMHLTEWLETDFSSCSRYGKRRLGSNVVHAEDRRIARSSWRFKTIAECLEEAVTR